MPTKEQRRQKKLAKKRSKEVSEKKARARQKNSLQSVAGQMKAASTGEIDRCFISSTLLDPELRLGTVMISRRMSDGRLGCARILVDGMCLGVKNALGLVLYPAHMTEMLDNYWKYESLRATPPADARKLVEGAIEYAGKYGFEASPEYQKIESIWGDIDPQDSSADFQFGDEDGKPVYVVDKSDSKHFQDKVVATLKASVGEGNFGVNLEAIFDSTDDEDGDWTSDPELDLDIDQDLIEELGDLS